VITTLKQNNLSHVWSQGRLVTVHDAFCGTFATLLAGMTRMMQIEERSQGNLVVVSLYKHPEFRIKYEHWEAIFNSCNPNTQKVIILGHFNLHISWDCDISDSYGRSLEDCISNLNMSILNNGQATSITSPQQKSVPST